LAVAAGTARPGEFLVVVVVLVGGGGAREV